MTVILDATGLSCPMPVLKAKKALGGIADGDALKLLSTDPGSKSDIPAFCSATGHTLEESGEEDGVFTYLIRK